MKKKNKPKRKCKFPCGICEKNVNKNQESIHCDNCGLWIHKSYEGLTDGEFQKLVEEEDDIPWTCFVCQIKRNAEIFPLGLLSKFKLLDLNSIDLPSHLQTLPSLETRSKLVNLPNLNDFDTDENIISAINSKYYSVDEINKGQLSKQHFSVFHTNIRSLSKHHDTLHNQRSMINIPFDVMGISETKEQIDNEFTSNVELGGYSMYSQPSKSLFGGCAIYVNSQLDHQVRNDLSVLEDQYATIWVEISNKKDKNFLCCCLHRHPSSDITKFIDHMTSILQKVQKENKTLLIMGDFNINLYNYCYHTETNDFINLTVSNYLLPHILHPTE